VTGTVGAGSEQDFTQPGRPGKLKTWKPDTVYGVADRRDFRISGFQVFTLVTGTGEVEMSSRYSHWRVN
jgi:hypothetical protein